MNSYTKDSMKLEQENLGAWYLEEKLNEIMQSNENEGEVHSSLFSHAKALEKEIQAYKNKQVAIERQQWEHYTSKLKAWARKHGLKTDSMEAGMTEPNKPHYNQANND